MEGHRLLWGDFHTHLVDLDRGDDILRDARENIDFYAVLCYPFVWDVKNALQVESVGRRPEFLQWWKEHARLAASHYAPGRFTTFLGYEWHGDRTRWGDHNVIYRDGDADGCELDDTADLGELYARLRGRNVFAIPHHTAYAPNQRSKDWSVWDAELSPVMEVVSLHGSSEGADTPWRMTGNSSMGPRAGGASWLDALARGLRVGVIGSNDSPGLPGRWNKGRAAVWARDCTRESIWEAISARRCYAVTGDRISLDFALVPSSPEGAGGLPMGSFGPSAGPVEARVSVAGSHAIDRIELIHNGVVADTYCHGGRWEGASGARRWKLRFVAGWGPCVSYGFKPPATWPWECRLRVEGGSLASIEKCFDLPGQRVTEVTPRGCAWHLETAGRNPRDPNGMTQGLVFEIEGAERTRIRIDAEGYVIEKTIGELARGPVVLPLIDEAKRLTLEAFGLDERTIGNPDSFYHNARKIKLHRAVPQNAWRVEHAFGNLELPSGLNHFYARVTQTNGQMAWSSPVWLRRD
jgi:hypothetical protein